MSIGVGFWRFLDKTYFGSSLFANTISFYTLVVTIFLLTIGVKKVSELITEFSERRRTAVFNFHTHLRSYLLRLKALIIDNNQRPLRSLYSLSPNESVYDKSNSALGKRLSDLACEFLQYLSTKGEQIPPADTKAKWEIWDNKINLLRGYLYNFLLIGTGERLPQFDTEEDIKNEVDELLALMKDIDAIIQEQIDKFYDDLEREKAAN
jgi:hypothetical protein